MQFGYIPTAFQKINKHQQVPKLRLVSMIEEENENDEEEDDQPRNRKSRQNQSKSVNFNKLKSSAENSGEQFLTPTGVKGFSKD